ncbi:hypothetical protein HpMMM59_07180 [Helicobacter pylori]
MNTNKNKNASHLTHEMKNEHGGLAEAGMKALITGKRFQVEREILEICYSNGYLPQKINLELNMMAQ